MPILYGLSRPGAEAIVPQVVVLGITRELGPVIAGLMIAGRVAAEGPLDEIARRESLDPTEADMDQEIGRYAERSGRSSAGRPRSGSRPDAASEWSRTTDPREAARGELG